MAVASHKFPTGVPYGKDVVERDFWRCPHKRCPDSHLNFTITLPKKWKAVDVPADPPDDEQPLRPIALFRPTSEPTAEIEVSGVLMRREVSPGDWLDLLLEGRGEEILDRRDTPTSGGIVSDILSSVQSDREIIVSRWLVIKDGTTLLVLPARVAENHYTRFVDPFLMAVAGFDFLKPGDSPLAESLHSFGATGPANFHLAYPKSWKLIEDPSSNRSAHVLQLVHKIEGVVVGKITCAVIARSAETEAQNLVDNYVAELKRGGVSLDTLSLEPATAGKNFESAWQVMADAAKGAGHVEVRTVVGLHPEGWFFTGTVSPTRRTQPDIWAINKRALIIVLEYLRTMPADARPDDEGEDGESPPAGNRATSDAVE